MKLIQKFYNYCKVNPIIFRRFFSRKESNNKNDILLTCMFIILISLTTALVFRSSCEIFKYDKTIKQFVGNEWNKVFHLYLLNCFDLEEEKDIKKVMKNKIPTSVLQFIDSLATDEDICTNKGVRVYPEIITIKSESGVLPKVQCYKFSEDYTYLTEYLTNTFHDTLITKRPYLFIQDRLSKKLNVYEDDIVFIKEAGIGDKYSLPLQVKPIKDKSRVKCFIFEHYLSDYARKKIRLYFAGMSDLFDFLLRKAVFEWKLDKEYPVYFGIGEDVFGFIYDRNKVSDDYDFIYQPKFISKTYDVTFQDSLKLLFVKEEKKYIYSININEDGFIELDKDDLFNKFLHIKHGFNNLDKDSVEISASFFVNFPRDDRDDLVFLEFDFIKNFTINARKRQVELIQYLEIAKDFSIEFDISTDLERTDVYRFFYYNKFEDAYLTKEILSKFDEFNIRWDSGRWKTIIDLNESLMEGKENIIFLLIISIVIFLLFLIIKLYLRLKIEFHTIGTIRCFGYNKKLLNRVYRTGYMILITSGFFIGVPLGIVISLLSGFDITLVVQSLGFVFSQYLIVYFIILQLLSFFIVGYILNKLVHVDDIYGLIKYEG